MEKVPDERPPEATEMGLRAWVRRLEHAALRARLALARAL